MANGSHEPEAFFEQVEGILKETERYFAEAALGPLAVGLRAPAKGCIDAIREEMSEALALAEGDDEARATMLRGLALAGTSPLLALALSQLGDELEDVDWSKVLSTAVDWIVTALKKIVELLGDGKLKTVLKDLTILLPQLKTLIDSGPDKVDELTLDVEELEAKVERFLHQVLGKPLVKVDDKKGAERIPPVDGPVEEPELSGSVLWFLWDIERKLEYLWARVHGGDFPRAGADKLITDPRDDTENRGNSIGKELDDLRLQIDCLTKLLGRTLYNTEWDCLGSIAPPPPAPPEGELHPVGPDGLRHERAIPPVSIKDEIHELERLIVWIINIFHPPEWPPEWPPGWPPPEEPPEDPVILADLKRIMVYEEGVFEARPGNDEETVEVRSAAFDLAGWVDLTELVDGQAVAVEMHVLLPGGVRRLYRQGLFSGAAQAGLYALGDIIGPNIVVGNAIDIVMRQTSGPPLDVPYQFVIETQRVRR
ncbi:hypothetical protein [Vannielia litorea]|uniref:hypothetical protein n=1 Tax=Vannielia litorea TaxID=1217970 RepID=UPI001BCD1146|nr:hypothetical protein [Vannielia litorea]MBS8226709.1 hypothetical protein [Vannielia litorea]